MLHSSMAIGWQFTHFPLAVGEQFLINNSTEISQKTSESWDFMWTNTLSGTLYQIMANLGVLIALICLGFFVVDFAQKWLRDESNYAMSELIFPMIVILLLANGGKNLAGATHGLRDAMNYYNNLVLQAVSAEVNFETAMSQLGDYSTVLNQMTAVRSQCNSIIDNQKLTDCLNLQNIQAQAMVREYQTQHPQAISWLQDLQARLQVNQVDPNRPLQSIANIGLSFTILPLVEAFLIAVQAAFQNLVEVSLLLTALIAPIAVGSSLLPFGSKPIFAWFSGFFGLGMCKLSLNLITGLVAVTMVRTGPTDTLPIAIFIGLLAPILALGIAAGGGMTIFNGVSSFGGQIASLGATGISGVATSMAARAGSAASRGTASSGSSD